MPPDLPQMWRAEARARLAEAAPAAAAEAEALAARADSAYAAAAAVMGGELERADFDWAWAMVQSRAMRVRHGSGPGARCLMPVADLLNHAPRCAGAGAGAAGRARPAGGPSASGAAEGDSFVFRAARALAPGEQVPPPALAALHLLFLEPFIVNHAVLFQVSWSYGRLSNEELLLGYGFVPRPRLHAGPPPPPPPPPVLAGRVSSLFPY